MEEPLKDPDGVEIDLKGGSGIEREVKSRTGSDDDVDISTEIDTNVRIAVAHKASWNDTAKEDIEFCLGKQWTDEEKATLNEQKRPCMTFNKIKPIIQLVSGHLIQRQDRIQVSPEGGEDEVFSAVMDKALDHVDKLSNLSWKMNYQFSGGERAGRTWLEAYIDYDEDPIFGRLKFNYLGAFNVYMDPSAREYDNSDANYGFKIIKLPKARLKQLYPKKKKDIDEFLMEDTLHNVVFDTSTATEGDSNNYGADPNRSSVGINAVTSGEEPKGDLKMFTTVEYWKKDYVDKWFLYFSDDGSIAEFDSEDEAKEEVRLRSETFVNVAVQEKQAQQELAVPDEGYELKHVIRKRRVSRMRFVVKAGELILTNDLVDSPFEPYYHGFPFFQYIAEWYPESEDEEYRVQSLVRSLKDPQKEVNKARSQYLHILNTSANSGWIGDADALSDRKWAELRQFGSTPGITIQKKKGSELQRIHPVEPSLAQGVREKSATDDFKEVSGINADLLAVDTSSAPSGKAISLRIQQAITILQPSFNNFRFTKRLVGDFIFKIMPMMFDEVKLSKVLGKNFMETRQIDISHLSLFMNQIKDGKYDVSIDESSRPDTLREETFENLMQMVQAGMPFPPDVLMEFMSIPNKGEVIKKVKEYQQQQAQQQAAIEAAKKGGGSPQGAAKPPAISRG